MARAEAKLLLPEPWPKTCLGLWGLVFAALALVPDQRLLRYKLLSVEAGVALILAALWLRAWRRSERWNATPLDIPVAGYAASALLFYLLSPEPRNSEAELIRMLF